MYIFEYRCQCLSYHVRIRLNDSTCKICRCHICKQLQTIAAYLHLRLRLGCHWYELICVSKFQRKAPSRQKWNSLPMVGFGRSTLSTVSKVRHMVEHSLHLLLRERSKEFGEPSLSWSFWWTNTDSLVQFGTIVTTMLEAQFWETLELSEWNQLSSTCQIIVISDDFTGLEYTFLLGWLPRAFSFAQFFFMRRAVAYVRESVTALRPYEHSEW